MRSTHFDSTARAGFLHWLDSTPTVRPLDGVTPLIAEIQRDPFTGIGQPEALKGDLPASWSRWIDDEHRLVDRADDSKVKILKAPLSVLTHRTPPAPLTP